MFNHRLPDRPMPIALDIGTDSIKMLQLGNRNGKLAVRAAGRWKFPEDSQQDAQRRTELAVSAVRNMLRSGAFRGRRVITALPSCQLGIKNIRLPHMSAEERLEAIKWEASERFAFDVSLDRLKYLHAGQVRQGNDTQDEIIMLAAAEETIQAHLAVLERMGLRPEHIDAEPVALFRVFGRAFRREADKDVVSVVVDIGSQSTRIVIARGQQIIFIKNIDIAGRRLTEAVARQLNLSKQEAGELRSLIMKEHVEDKSLGGEDDEKEKNSGISQSVSWTIQDAVRAEVEALGREIGLCLRYCSVTFRGLRPKRITITGGQAYDPSVVKLLGEQLGIEYVVGRPLRGIDVSEVSLEGQRRGVLAEWTLCAGLALRSVPNKTRAQGKGHGKHRLSA